MIAAPLNDRGCLGAITDTMIALVQRRDPSLLDVASRFESTDALARWIRTLPQRDDLGQACDGPKVNACSPPQRLRIAPDDPNCVERAALYIGAAELIDPRPSRSLTTIDVVGGRHTLPVEDGAPVVLDPSVSRNAVRAELWKRNQRRNGPTPIGLSPTEAVDWIALLAAEPAQCFDGGIERVRSGHRAMRTLLAGQSIDAEQAGDLAFVLGLAHHEAHAFGPTGRCIVGTATLALDQIDQETQKPRNAFRLGKYTVEPDYALMAKVGRIGGRVAGRVGMAAAREKLAALGLSPPVLADLEHELNREGLSLGPLARPAPMPGTLAAVTPEALAGRWLAQRLP